MAELKARHAFGSSANLEQALSNNIIDEYDILFLDGDTDEPKVGWVDKNGQIVICQDETGVTQVDALPEAGESGKIYIYQNEGYVWDAAESKFVAISKSADLSALEEQIAAKADAAEVNAQIEATLVEHLGKIAAYKVADAPDGTVVKYLDKELRVMVPSDHQWVLRPSGANADQTAYYIGVKAYAPEGAASFKEDMKQVIEDETMYYFEGNDFAGVEDDGRKFSIIWLPVAAYDADTATWTYHGASSTEDKYRGWYYAVEWYDADGEMLASDCIRINLANEDCFGMPKPYYVGDAVKSANAYTDEQIANKVDEETVDMKISAALQGVGAEVIEF